MYAVIETGGKQYFAQEGEKVRIEKVAVEEGKQVKFENVLMIGGEGTPKFGTPIIEGASVTGTVVEQGKDRKILVYHKKRRKGYEKKNGHRQPFTEVKISKITA